MAESAKVFLYGNHGRQTYGIRQYVVDDESGVSELPTDVHIGSSCLVIATGDVYVINSEGKWIKVLTAGKASGGGSSPGGNESGGGSEEPSDEEYNLIYDGGEVK